MFDLSKETIMATGDIITMRQKELRRLHIAKQVLKKELKQIEASEVLGISDRQIRRIIKREREEGDKGIIHKLRGKVSKRRIRGQIRARVIGLYKKSYRGFGPTFAVEKLSEINEIEISRETLRNWLIEEGLWERCRKRKKHRHWRERKHRFGEMVQVDGSHHDWFEGRGPECVLMGYIDDATSKRHSRFYGYEGTLPAFDSLKRYIKRYGIPKSLYLDRHTTYKSTAKPTLEDELNNRKQLSQVERAARELDIDIIHASSPQAKGRAERSFRTYQDRLVKEMRLKGIRRINEANKFLKEYLPKHNRKFSVEPIKEGNLHRPVPKGMDLDSILCIKEERVIRNDFTIVYKKKLYQILNKTMAKKVMVEKRINGRIYITSGGENLRYKSIKVKPQRIKPELKVRKANKPLVNNSWKNFKFGRLAANLEHKELENNLVLANT